MGLDYDDGDDLIDISWQSGGWVAVACLVLAVCVYLSVWRDSTVCAERVCEVGKPAYVKGECLCISQPKEASATTSGVRR